MGMSQLQAEFFRMGLDYYAAGRFAAIGGLYSVAGNLLHHAVEMLLKGALSDVLSEKQRFGFRHRLDELWKEYKRHSGDATLNTFDSALLGLDKFEEIRYPEKPVAEGMILQIAFEATGVDPAFVDRAVSPRAYVL